MVLLGLFLKVKNCFRVFLSFASHKLWLLSKNLDNMSVIGISVHLENTIPGFVVIFFVHVFF